MITSSTYVCPYCGDATDAYGQSKQNLGKVILEIRNKYGSEIIDDTARLNALLMDYVPEMAKERKLVINAIKEGVLFQLRRGFDEGNDYNIVIKRCIAFLVSEMWVTETAAKYAVDSISYALGYIVSNSDQPENVIKADSEDKQLNKGDKEFGTIIKSMELDSYESIGYKAFASNKILEEINFPDSIKLIYPKAFMNCTSLKRVKLCKNIQNIGRSVFDGCISLDSIQVEDNSNYTVSNGLLIDKKNKKLIRSANQGETKVSIVNGIITINKKAFERSKVECITIPRTVEDIEEDAFYLTMNLQRIDVENTNAKFRSIDGVLHDRNGKKLLRYPQGKKDIAYYLEDGVLSINKKAFSCTTVLSSITFSSGLKEIGENAFEYCTGLEHLMFPRSVVVIGERAFQYCLKLKSVMLPQGIIRIGDCAFQGCELLQSVSIPRSVSEIGNMAFENCKSLSSVVIQDNIKFIGDGAFNNCPGIDVTIIGNEYVETYCRMRGIRYKKG